MEASTSTNRSPAKTTTIEGFSRNWRREPGHPRQYTLYCLDKNQIPNFILRECEDAAPTFKEIAYCLQPNICRQLEENKDSGEMEPVSRKNKPDREKKKPEIYEDGEGEFFWIRFWQQRVKLCHERLASKFFLPDNNSQSSQPFWETSSMMIIPKPRENPKHALVYTFGHANSKLNQLAIVHCWGVKVGHNRRVCGDNLILKAWRVRSDYSFNPRKKSMTSSKPLPIDACPPIEGCEYIQSTRIRSDIKDDFHPSDRLMNGADYLQFELKEVDLDVGRCDTVKSLIEAGKHYYNVWRCGLENPDEIHPKSRMFIEQEVVDDNAKAALNKRLLEILKDTRSYEQYFVDVADHVFRHMGKWVQFSAEDNDPFSFGRFKPALKTAMEMEGAYLGSPIYVRHIDTKCTVKEFVFKMICAFPIEFGNTNDNKNDDKNDDRNDDKNDKKNDNENDNKEFYRFESGRWFVIPESRFEHIRTRLNDFKICNSEECGLISYAGSKYTETYDKERAYNEDAVTNFEKSSDDPSSCAILVDKLLIFLPPDAKHDKFEFGDIFVVKGDVNYIIHVKRLSSGTATLSHHCIQVVRCIEYLSHVLKRKNDWKILVQGCIDSLYIKHGMKLQTRKDESKNKGRGKGFYRTNTRTIEMVKKKTESEWETCFLDKIEKATETRDTVFKKRLNDSIPEFLQKYKFFNGSNPECVAFLNALFDCDNQMQSESKELLWETAETFFDTLRQCFDIKKELFHDGFISEKAKDKTHIIMAFIDEKGTFRKFQKQTLPALDYVITKVADSGFKFGWTVVKNSSLDARSDDDCNGSEDDTDTDQSTDNENKTVSQKGKRKRNRKNHRKRQRKRIDNEDDDDEVVVISESTAGK